MLVVVAFHESVCPIKNNCVGLEGDKVSSAIERKTALSLPACKTGGIIRRAIMKIKVVDTKDLKYRKFYFLFCVKNPAAETAGRQSQNSNSLSYSKSFSPIVLSTTDILFFFIFFSQDIL